MLGELVRYRGSREIGGLEAEREDLTRPLFSPLNGTRRISARRFSQSPLCPFLRRSDIGRYRKEISRILCDCQALRLPSFIYSELRIPPALLPLLPALACSRLAPSLILSLLASQHVQASFSSPWILFSKWRVTHPDRWIHRSRGLHQISSLSPLFSTAAPHFSRASPPLVPLSRCWGLAL